MTECACKPGSANDGWQEVRCEDCNRVEMDAWRRAITSFRNGQRKASA